MPSFHGQAAQIVVLDFGPKTKDSRWRLPFQEGQRNGINGIVAIFCSLNSRECLHRLERQQQVVEECVYLYAALWRVFDRH